MKKTLRLLTLGLIMLIVIGSVTAIAATNTVPITRAADQILPVGINEFKPSACAGWYLSSLVTGSGTITGTAGNDLILGGFNADSIDGQGGNDCILGGGGDDLITGGDGNDVCIGGADNDSFVTCEAELQ